MIVAFQWRYPEWNGGVISTFNFENEPPAFWVLENTKYLIPTGEWIYKREESPRLKAIQNPELLAKYKKYDFKTFEAVSIPNRSEIQFHPANEITQLKGCQAPGLDRTTIEIGGILTPYVFWSFEAWSTRFMDRLRGEDQFKLVIQSVRA
jgi:hypothetical protein